MKKILLLATAILFTVVGTAQCVADHDFGEQEFGVSPNPNEGEEFEQAILNESYSDTIHVIVPTDAGVVNEAFTGFTIDSLSLDGVFVMLGTEMVELNTIGLEVECNNNGDSSNPCTFLGGQQYCALVEGIPNTAGELPLQINVTGYLLFLGEVQNIPFSFDGFTLSIVDPNFVSDVPQAVYSLEQNVPNPFKENTEITFGLENAGQANFVVSNILGEIVYQEIIQGRRGNNTIRYSAATLESGIYLYSIEANSSKVTKRMIVR